MESPPKPIRVLQVVTQMHRAGLETMLMNYFRNIDRSQICFDFLTHRNGSFDYDDEIRTLGGKIYTVPSITLGNFRKYLLELKHFFASHNEYNIVHCHLDALSTFALEAAQKAGVRKRIAHSHNNGFEMNKKLPLRYISKQFIPLYATDFWGCSNEAISFMFGRKFLSSSEVLINAIDIDNFTFSCDERNAIRDHLGINGKFVVGNVGRLCYQKNQSFLLDIFFEIKKRRPLSVLLIAGDGEDRKVLEDKSKFLGIDDSVIFMSNYENIGEFLSALDVFVFPSLFEGFGIALLEAQASGLPCVASNVSVPEVRLSDNITFLDVDSPCEDWAEAVLSTQPREENLYSPLKGSIYDISIAAAKLQEKYISLLE